VRALFWIPALLLAWAQVGYGAFLSALRRLGVPAWTPPEPGAEQPRVSLIVAAHREEAVIAAKVANALALDWPRDRIEVIVAVDGGAEPDADATAERARAAGADVVVALEGDVDQLTARLQDACNGKADVVVDPVFGAAASAACRVLSEGGRLVNLGGASGDAAELSSAVLRSRSLQILGYTNNALEPAERAAALNEVAQHAAAGRLAVAHEVLPLARVDEAWRRQATGTAGVRLVLTP
jgi:hypothetical protein